MTIKVTFSKLLKLWVPCTLIGVGVAFYYAKIFEPRMLGRVAACVSVCIHHGKRKILRPTRTYSRSRKSQDSTSAGGSSSSGGSFVASICVGDAGSHH